MTNATKRSAIVFLILATLVVVLLAVALPQLELQEAIPLPQWIDQAEGTGQPGVANSSLQVNLSTVFKTIIGLFILMTIIFLLVNRRRVNWRGILKDLLKLAALSTGITLVLYAFSCNKISMTPSTPELLPPEVTIVSGPALAPVPAFLLWLVWLVLAGAVLLGVIGMMRARIQRRREAPDLLALEAEQAVAALKAGQDLANVIIRCYEQMSLILKEEQGLSLEKAMTAREFEALLEKRGVPNAPVHQLTQLFEIARYAPQAPNPVAEAQAVACLNEIAQHSQKKAQGQPR